MKPSMGDVLTGSICKVTVTGSLTAPGGKVTPTEPAWLIKVPPVAGSITAVTTSREGVAAAVTVVVWVAVLFDESGSGVELETVAVLVRAPAVAGRTTIVSVRLVPLANEPRSHERVALPLAGHSGDAEITLTPAGRVLATRTASAAAGPWLLTVSV